MQPRTPIITSAVILTAGLLAAAVLVGCGKKPPAGGIESPTIDVAAFARLAATHDAANKVNRLYVIDGKLVFWRWEGTYSDASYGRTLFGATPEQILIDEHDSIAGPMRDTRDPAHTSMFDTIVKHMEDPQLGLAPDHVVREVPLRR
jgi:hypothetical protein